MTVTGNRSCAIWSFIWHSSDRIIFSDPSDTPGKVMLTMVLVSWHGAELSISQPTPRVGVPHHTVQTRRGTDISKAQISCRMAKPTTRIWSKYPVSCIYSMSEAGKFLQRLVASSIDIHINSQVHTAVVQFIDLDNC